MNICISREVSFTVLPRDLPKHKLVGCVNRLEKQRKADWFTETCRLAIAACKYDSFFTEELDFDKWYVFLYIDRFQHIQLPKLS